MASESTDGVHEDEWGAALSAAIHPRQEEEENEDVLIPLQRGVGRPKGTVGGRVSRDRIQQARQEAIQEAAASELSLPVVPAVGARLAMARKEQQAQRKAESNARVAQYGDRQLLCKMGCKAQQQLACALLDTVQKGQPQMRAADQVLSHILEGKAATTSASALAAMSDHNSKSHVLSLFVLLGAASLEFSGLMWSCALTMFKSQCVKASGATGLVPLMFVLKVRYDETPSRVRVATVAESSSSTVAGRHVVVPKSASHPQALRKFLDAMLKDLPSGSESVTHAKLLQSEIKLAMLFQSRAPGQVPSFLLVSGSVPTALQAMDRSTGENQRQCIYENICVVPELRRLYEGFPLRYRVSCTDRYGANFRTESGLSADGYLPELTNSHWPCDTHKSATVLSTALRSVPDDVTGLVNTGLTVGALGSLKQLRDLLNQVLFQELQIKQDLPPASAKAHRDEIYRLFLPVEGVLPAVRRLNRKRRYILASFLNGHLNDQPPTHFCDIDCCASKDETLCNVSLFVVWALLPKPCPLMARKNWVNQLPNTDWVGLLESHHGLYSKLMLLHMGSPKALTLRTPNLQQETQALAIQADGDWNSALQMALGLTSEDTPGEADWFRVPGFTKKVPWNLCC